MISKLKVVVTITLADTKKITKTITLDALQLLGLLQQALPGIKAPTGNGTLARPWEPKTPAEWFYCAKVSAIAHRDMLNLGRLKMFADSATLVNAARRSFPGVGTKRKAWLKIGGRRIRILASNLYSSDCGLATNVIQSGSHPPLVYENASYPVIWGVIQNWMRTQAKKDQDLTAGMRKALKGLGGALQPDILPLLTNVLFVSEVARNHTAFHSALMMLDLLEYSVKAASTMKQLPTGQINWEWALWQPEGKTACPDCGRVVGKVNCPDCRGYGYYDAGLCRTCHGYRGTRKNPCRNRLCINGRHSPNCQRCRGKGLIRCGTCKGSGDVRRSEMFPLGRDGNTSKGGVEKLQAGLLPMSHTGSAQGSAYDLGGMGAYFGVWKPGRTPSAFKPLHILTIVRRKEATILAVWLTIALKAWAAKTSLNPKLKKVGIQSITIAPTPLTVDLTVNSASGERVYTGLTDVAKLGIYSFDDWLDKWKATRRDLASFPTRPQHPAARFPGRMDQGTKPIPLKQLPYDKFDIAKRELIEYQSELVDYLLQGAILKRLQQRVDSMDALLP